MKHNLKQNLIFVLLVILLFMNLGRSYYFHYLFILFIVFITNHNKKELATIYNKELLTISPYAAYFSALLLHIYLPHS